MSEVGAMSGNETPSGEQPSRGLRAERAEATPNVVPATTRLGAWQARLVGSRVFRAAQRELARVGVALPAAGPRPAVRVPDPGPSFEGRALRWALVPNAAGAHLEVELHRAPCNEIGTTALAELEALATFVRGGAGGAKALLLHSTVPKGFCAGADLRELYAALIERRAAAAGAGPIGRALGQLAIAHEVRGFVDRIHAVFDTLDMAPLTTVGAVHGFCFGGGFELALTCDVLVADKSARFAFPELRLGLVPGFGGIPRLRRDLGNAVVRDLLLTGRSMNASRAHEVGLVSQVVPRGSALEIARKVAEQACRFDLETTARAKAFTKPLPREALAREKDLFVEMIGSPVVEAALRKFVESTDVRPYLP
ncbi:MAG: enoyl-CoA hydratase/isomerase family protein [Myxococcales bacterium]|nr:enoyl-CoA hydratase/isomerase family protein [Myxococcales bacterium]